MPTLKKGLWYFCCLGMFCLAALCFSPYVLSPGNEAADLLGLPPTLWRSMVIAFANLALAFIATRVHPYLATGRDTDK